MDTITLCDLEVRYRVGITAAERAQPQLLLLTVVLSFDLAPAGASDNLADTINYQAVADRLLALGWDREWNLIECLAEDLARILLAEFPAQAVALEIKKFVIPQTRYVSVGITRRRTPPAPPGLRSLGTALAALAVGLWLPGSAAAAVLEPAGFDTPSLEAALQKAVPGDTVRLPADIVWDASGRGGHAERTVDVLPAETPANP